MIENECKALYGCDEPAYGHPFLTRSGIDTKMRKYSPLSFVRSGAIDLLFVNHWKLLNHRMRNPLRKIKPQ